MRYITVGSKWGRLTVWQKSFIKKERRYWKCKCECGKTSHVSGSNLLNGHSKSCGCLATELLVKRATHGHSRGYKQSPEYRAWAAMKNRCYSPNNNRYYIYGDRGIFVCDEWLNDFNNFIKDMGKRPEKTSLDRIDTNKGYCKENCRWATAKEQAVNRRSTNFYVINGESLTIEQIANKIGRSYSYTHKKIRVEKIQPHILINQPDDF